IGTGFRAIDGVPVRVDFGRQLSYDLLILRLRERGGASPQQAQRDELRLLQEPADAPEDERMDFGRELLKGAQLFIWSVAADGVEEGKVPRHILNRNGQPPVLLGWIIGAADDRNVDRPEFCLLRHDYFVCTKADDRRRALRLIRDEHAEGAFAAILPNHRDDRPWHITVASAAVDDQV